MHANADIMTDDRTRDAESGRYGQEYAADDFLAAIEAADGPVPTQEVATAVGVSRSQALRRLHALADAGEVRRIDAGRAYVWTVAE
jgi:predicted transcriptional regulator